MRLCIDNQGRYIRAVVEDGARQAVLRRWPWPNNEPGRKKHFREAMEYAQLVGAVLLCPIDVAK